MIPAKPDTVALHDGLMNTRYKGLTAMTVSQGARDLAAEAGAKAALVAKGLSPDIAARFSQIDLSFGKAAIEPKGHTVEAQVHAAKNEFGKKPMIVTPSYFGTTPGKPAAPEAKTPKGPTGPNVV